MVGPDGKLKKKDKYKPVTDEVIPKNILTNIDATNVLVTSFDDAAGISNILSTKIIPTVWSEATIDTDKIIRNK